MGRKQTAKQESFSLEETVESVPAVSASTPESRVGDLLKRYREDKNISLKQVSQKLCIRQTFLKAIEEGSKNKLPERVYTMGFIRSYSHFLGLDEEAILKEYRKEISIDPESSSYIFPASVQKQSLPSSLNYIIGVLLVATAIFTWMYFRESFTPATSKPLVSSEPAPSSKTPTASESFLPSEPIDSSDQDLSSSPSPQESSFSPVLEENPLPYEEDPKKSLEVPGEES